MEDEPTSSGIVSPKSNKQATQTNSKYILLNKSTIQNPPCNVDISNRVLCIEYPGIVDNIDNAIETLGGLHAIEMAVGNYNRRLELKYRPNDVFSKPCWGEKDYNSGILVKIKVCQPKNNNTNTSSPSQSNETTNDFSTTYRYDVIGVSAMTFKFSRLCDFQYLPLVPTNKKKENAQTPCKYIYDDIIPKELPTWDWFISKEATSMPLFFTPPIFSRFNMSTSNKLYFERYKYYESLIPEFAEKLKRDAQKKQPVPKNIITRTRSERKLHSVFISPLGRDTVIPLVPPKGALDTIQRLALDGHPLKNLKELFDERPIWSKAALQHQTGIRYDRLKYLLPCVAYYFPSGPWRVMWCRYGFDPRLESFSRIYQTFDFRIRTSDGLKVKVQPKKGFSNIMHYKAGPTTVEKFSLRECCVQKAVPKPAITEEHYILKPNMLPPARQMFYQYCDLHIPEIQNMLKRLPEVPKSALFDLKNGWLPNGFSDQCREIANRYITGHVKTLLLEDKKRDDEDKTVKQPEEHLSSTSSVEDRNLPSPILILDDDDEENPFSKNDNGLYSDANSEDDQLMDSDEELILNDIELEDEEANMKAVDEMDDIIGNVDNNESQPDIDSTLTDESLPPELRKLFRKLIVSSSETKDS